MGGVGLMLQTDIGYWLMYLSAWQGRGGQSKIEEIMITNSLDRQTVRITYQQTNQTLGYTVKFNNQYKLQPAMWANIQLLRRPSTKQIPCSIEGTEE